VIYGHANAEEMAYTNNNGEPNDITSPKQLHDVLISKVSQYKEAIRTGKPVHIKLKACQLACKSAYVGGKYVTYKQTFAQRYSRLLPKGSTVTAADGFVLYTKIGGIVCQNKKNFDNNKGAWITYRGGQEVKRKVVGNGTGKAQPTCNIINCH
jgi:hypothetical protein